MPETTQRSTVYLKKTLHRALRLKSVEVSRSMSDLMNDAVIRMLGEDAEDLAAFDERKHEPLVSFEDMLKGLKKRGRI